MSHRGIARPPGPPYILNFVTVTVQSGSNDGRLFAIASATALPFLDSLSAMPNDYCEAQSPSAFQSSQQADKLFRMGDYKKWMCLSIIILVIILRRDIGLYLFGAWGFKLSFR